jgi:hypothetical protein
MCTRAIVVDEVGYEESPQKAFTEDDDMVEALAPCRADQALDEGVLPEARGALKTSSMPIPVSRSLKVAP